MARYRWRICRQAYCLRYVTSIRSRLWRQWQSLFHRCTSGDYASKAAAYGLVFYCTHGLICVFYALFPWALEPDTSRQTQLIDLTLKMAFTLKRTLAVCILLFTICHHLNASAHGLPIKKHNGLTTTELDLGFEIFVRANRLVLYVTDHDSPFDTKLFEGEAHIGRRIWILNSAEGGELISEMAAPRDRLKNARVVLRAKVLPRPIELRF